MIPTDSPTNPNTRLPNARAALLLGLATTAILLSPLAATAQADPVEIRGNCVYVLPDGARIGPVYTTGGYACTDGDLPGVPTAPQCIRLPGAQVGPVHAEGAYVCTIP